MCIKMMTMHRKPKHASKHEHTTDEKPQSEKTIKHKYEREHRRRYKS